MITLTIRRPKIIKISVLTLLLSIYFTPLYSQTDLSALVKKLSPSVVSINVYDRENELIGTGTGFFISDQGYLVTNYHVIEDGVRAEAKLFNGEVLPIEGLLSEDIEGDLVLLSLGVKGRSFSSLKLAVKKIDIGQPVVVIGNPFGLEGTVSNGIVSAIRDMPELGKFLQITAPISPGSSGSPVINMQGEVVGVATLSFTEGQNLNFAIPVSKAASLLSHRKAKPLTLLEIIEEKEKRMATDKLFAIKKNGKWGYYIDRTGKEIISPQFEDAYYFSEGLAAVKFRDKLGFIDKTGRFVIEPQFGFFPYPYFSDGLAAVNVAVSMGFEASIGLENAIGFIDRRGKFVIRPQFQFVFPFSEGLAAVRFYRDGKFGFVDKVGQIVIYPKFDFAYRFSEGLAPIRIGDKWGFVDKSGSYSFSPLFDDVGIFSEGLAKIGINGKKGYIDRTEKIIISPQFDDAMDFSQGLAAVKCGGKWGFIDKTGKIVINPRFDRAGTFSAGLAEIGINGRTGYIDKTGKYIWEPTD